MRRLFYNSSRSLDFSSDLSGRLYSWGKDFQSGQLGTISELSKGYVNLLPPIMISSLKGEDINFCSCGLAHSVAISSKYSFFFIFP